MSPRLLWWDHGRRSDGSVGAEHGLIVLNIKNLLDYDALWPSSSTSYPEKVGIDLVQAQVGGIIVGLNEIPLTTG
jgi:hypothetical protein